MNAYSWALNRGEIFRSNSKKHAWPTTKIQATCCGAIASAYNICVTQEFRSLTTVGKVLRLLVANGTANMVKFFSAQRRSAHSAGVLKKYFGLVPREMTDVVARLVRVVFSHAARPSLEWVTA